MDNKNNLVYWILFAHLPKWTTLKTNKLIIEILHNQEITFEKFFNLSHQEWIEIFQLSDKEINDLEQAKKDLANYSFLLEDILNQGYGLIPINSKDYPQTLKDNLKLKFAPSLLYIKGNKSLLHDDTIAIVGSRKANEKSLEFTKNIAIKAKNEYKCVVSGGAKGVDQVALEESLRVNGHSILVLPQGIFTASSLLKKYYKYIIDGNLLILSAYHPKAGWSTGLAMGRNKYIYGLSKEIYVAESNSKGGTWSGALEGLKVGRKIYIRKPNNNEKNANLNLIEKGAIPVDINGTLINSSKLDYEESLREILDNKFLTLEEIKEKLNITDNAEEFVFYLENLSFIEKKENLSPVRYTLKVKVVAKTIEDFL